MGEDGSMVHQHREIGMARHFVQVVKDDDDAPPSVRQSTESLVQQQGLPRIEGRGRLIEKEGSRSGRQSPGEDDALLLSQGELGEHSGSVGVRAGDGQCLIDRAVVGRAEARQRTPMGESTLLDHAAGLHPSIESASLRDVGDQFGPLPRWDLQKLDPIQQN